MKLNVTTLLDLAGLFFLSVAASIWAAFYFLPLGFAAFGVCLLGISWIIDRKRRRK